MGLVGNKKGIYKYSLLLSLVVALIIGAGWLATEYLGNNARQEIIKETETAASTLSVYFSNTMREIAGDVETLAGSPWIAPALISPTHQNIANANSVLDRYSAALGLAVCYLIDRTGTTIASSNRTAPDSFVGNNYRFRPYFVQAMNGDRGQYFALGVTSGKRGLYGSHPVRDARGTIIGAAVIKKDLDEIEAHLGNYPMGFMVDPHGIIFLSSRKDFLFKSLWPVGRETANALIASRQFGDKPFQAVMPREIGNGMDVPLQGSHYYVSRKILNPEGWSLVLMAPTQKVFWYKSTGMAVTLLLCFLAVISAVIIHMAAISIERRRAEEALQKSEAMYYDLYENAPDMYFSVYLPAGTIRECNETFVRVTGYTKEEVIGRSIFDLYEPDDREAAKESCQEFARTGEFQNKERRVRCKDGRVINVSLNVSAVRDGEGNILYSRSIWHDITERKQYEKMINDLAITDLLTNLYNRRGFIALAEQQVKQAERNKQGLLLLFADLDNMKQINDGLGHKAGDEALLETADVFREVFRKMDIIGRIGGDEFAVLAVEGSQEYSDIIKKRLQDQLDAHNARAGRNFSLSISVGTAYYDPEHPSSLDELMSNADSLMYEQKRNKRL